MAAWDVVGLGANSLDIVHLLPGHPSGPSAKMRIAERHLLCGGQMLTAICACARFGLRAKYVGVTGADDHGARVRQELARHGIDIADVIVRDAPNQYAVILVDQTSGERIVLWDRDEKLLMRPREIPTEAIAAARLLHVDDVDQDAAIRAAEVARHAGIPVTSDIDRITDRTAEVIRAVTIAIVAEHVLPELTGIRDPERALRKLRERYDGLLCVTLGDRGAMALDGDVVRYAPAFDVDAVDTTGAGDVFRAGFIYALLRGATVDQMLRMGNAAAAVSCTRLGALGGIPSLDDVTQMDSAGAARV